MAIILPSGFQITSTDPVDSRFSVANQAARFALATANVYPGLLVYQQDVQLTYLLINVANVGNSTGWQIVTTGVSGSYATTGSNIFSGSQVVSGSLSVNGSTVITANQTSSMTVATASYFSGSISTAISSSYAATASVLLGSVESASYALYAVSSSQAATSSYTLSSSLSVSSSLAQTASFVTGSDIIGTVASASYISGPNFSANKLSTVTLGSVAGAYTEFLTLSGGTSGGINVIISINNNLVGATSQVSKTYIVTSQYGNAPNWQVVSPVSTTSHNGPSDDWELLFIQTGSSGTFRLRSTEGTTGNPTTFSINIYNLDGVPNLIITQTDTTGADFTAYSLWGGSPIMNIGASQQGGIGQVAIGTPYAQSGSVLTVSGSTALSGSLKVKGGITGSLFGTASYAVTSSYAQTASYFSGSISNAISASYALTASFTTTAQTASYVNIARTASFVTASNVVGTIASASFALTASYFSGSITNAVSSSYAQTASYVNALNQDITLTGSLNIKGTITADSASFTYLTTIYETSSVVYSSGSNTLGDASNDTQTLWGTVNLPSGPLVVTGSVYSSDGFTGSLQGTASYAQTASYFSGSISAAISSSYAASASYADTASYFSGSVSNAISASYALTSSFSLYAVTSSFSLTSSLLAFGSTTAKVTSSLASIFLIQSGNNTVLNVDSTGSLTTSGSIASITSGSFTNLLLIKNNNIDYLKVNGQGVLQLNEYATPPTAVTGGLYFDNVGNFYVGM